LASQQTPTTKGTNNMGIDPISLSLIAAATGAAGAAVGGVGAIAKGQAAKQSADYNTAVDNQMAAEAKDQAAANEQDYIRKGSDTESTAVADQGASGVTGSGSALLVDENTVRQVALGASRITQAGQLQASRYSDAGTLSQMQGNDAVNASYLDAASSLLSGASKFANPKFGTGDSSNTGIA
jgi:hypothetical protein